MDKLKMQTPDITENNVKAIKKLFPHVVTETRGENGKVKKAVDFDLLRQILSKDLVEESDERYRLDWPGKKASLLKANTPINKTLRPCREESVNFDTTENLYIEGDNFEVLKILQESYLGKVKMIYIDPPYNTGKDFIYKDNFKVSVENYEEELGIENENGEKLFKNTDSNGRFHSDWLSMMYERLVVARDLLREDGVIFISIDDNEVQNLRKICDEIFGEENFTAQFIWNTEGNTDNQYKVKINHEYILSYYKDISYSENSIGYVIDPNTPEDSNLRKGYADNNINKNNPANPPSIIELPLGFPSCEKELHYSAKIVDEQFFEISKKEKFISDELKEKYSIEAKSGLPIKLDDMIVKNYKLASQCRIYTGVANKNKLLEFIKSDCKDVIDDDGKPISFYINSNAAVRYRKKREKARNILSVLRNLGTTEKNKTELKKNGILFDYPKPWTLINYLVKIGCDNKDGIILDFFSGSGTTAQSILQLNAEDGGHRKFIMVQLPEKTDDNSEAYKAGYNSIAEIGKERIRRIGKNIVEELGHKKQQLKLGEELVIDSKLDIGFRVYKTAKTNMKDVFYHPSQLKQENIEMFESNIKEDRSPEDLLTQVLLDLGLTLDLPMEQKIIKGNTVFFVQTNSLVACFDNDINFNIVDEVAKVEPLKVVFKDASFTDDKDRINVEERFKRLSPETKVSVI